MTELHELYCISKLWKKVVWWLKRSKNYNNFMLINKVCANNKGCISDVNLSDWSVSSSKGNTLSNEPARSCSQTVYCYTSWYFYPMRKIIRAVRGFYAPLMCKNTKNWTKEKTLLSLCIRDNFRIRLPSVMTGLKGAWWPVGISGVLGGASKCC